MMYVSLLLEEVTLTLTDARWVGAWWLGVLICGSVNLLAGMPFWFLPKTLFKEGEESDTEVPHRINETLVQGNGKNQVKQNMYEIAKGKLNNFILLLLNLSLSLYGRTGLNTAGL